MSGLQFDCDDCGSPLKEPGALRFLIGPPNAEGECRCKKEHVCVKCYFATQKCNICEHKAGGHFSDCPDGRVKNVDEKIPMLLRTAWEIEQERLAKKREVNAGLDALMSHLEYAACGQGPDAKETLYWKARDAIRALRGNT